MNKVLVHWCWFVRLKGLDEGVQVRETIFEYIASRVLDLLHLYRGDSRINNPSFHFFISGISIHQVLTLFNSSTLMIELYKSKRLPPILLDHVHSYLSLFQQLPTKLRLQVWKLAMPDSKRYLELRRQKTLMEHLRFLQISLRSSSSTMNPDMKPSGSPKARFLQSKDSRICAYTSISTWILLNWTIKNENSGLLQEALKPH